MGRRLPRGILIVFDGIDGAGKTTQTSILAESLNRYGYDVVTSKEPTSGKWGQRLRDSAAKGRLAPGEELVLFMEDRMEHVRDLIAPSLAAGKIVVLDRYYFSTAAYQGALGMDPEKILAQNEAFAPKPDILFLLEVTPRVGLARIAGRGDVANHFEKEDNLLRCAEIFSAIDRPFLRHTDATRSIKDVGDEVLWAVCEGPIKDRLDEPGDGPRIRPDRIEDFMRAAAQISRDDSIDVGRKAEALASLLGEMT